MLFVKNKEFLIPGIFLDFSNAFNTFNHDILLDNYGIKGNALVWFKVAYRTENSLLRIMA